MDVDKIFNMFNGDNLKPTKEELNSLKKMNEFKNKFGDFSSLINVSVPKANNKYYDNSIELFAKHVRI